MIAKELNYVNFSLDDVLKIGMVVFDGPLFSQSIVTNNPQYLLDYMRIDIIEGRELIVKIIK